MNEKHDTLVLASGNAGKLEELRAMLADLPLRIVAQGELGVEDVPETGLTFVENALIKARHASAATGLPALADDSGLIVDALGGAPGLYSARYAGTPTNAAANNAKLLDALREVPAGQRSARFYANVSSRLLERKIAVFLEASLGGPAAQHHVTSKTMYATHAHLFLTEDDLNVFVEHVTDVLRENEADDVVMDAVMQLVESLKDPLLARGAWAP